MRAFVVCCLLNLRVPAVAPKRVYVEALAQMSLRGVKTRRVLTDKELTDFVSIYVTILRPCVNAWLQRLASSQRLQRGATYQDVCKALAESSMPCAFERCNCALQSLRKTTMVKGKICLKAL